MGRIPKKKRRRRLPAHTTRPPVFPVRVYKDHRIKRCAATDHELPLLQDSIWKRRPIRNSANAAVSDTTLTAMDRALGLLTESFGPIVVLEGVEAELHHQDFSIRQWNYRIHNPPGSKGSDLCRCGRGRTTVTGDGVSHCEVCGPPRNGESLLDNGRSETRAQSFGSAHTDRLQGTDS